MLTMKQGEFDKYILMYYHALISFYDVNENRGKARKKLQTQNLILY